MNERPLKNVDDPKRNGPLLKSLRTVQRVAERLARRGLTLRRVEAGESRPVIWLGDACSNAGLNGVLTVRRLRAGSIERVFAAELDGCLVKWTERGGGR